MARGRKAIYTDSQGRKRCGRCKQYKPLREFYNASHTRDGKSGYCVECANLAQKEWRKKHKPVEDKRGKYIRTKRVSKPQTNEERRIRLLEYGWIPKDTITRRCESCKRLRSVEVINESNICAVCSRKSNKPITKRKAGRPRKYNYRTELGRKRAFARTETHRANVKASKHRRRAREKAGGSFTPAEWLALLEKYNYTCLCCGDNTSKLTPDHIKPLALGGSNTIDNIQPLCIDCNTRKGATEVDYRNVPKSSLL